MMDGAFDERENRYNEVSNSAKLATIGDNKKSGKGGDFFNKILSKTKGLLIDDLDGFKGAKEKGLLRQEGKDYIMKDGDVVEFLFNV